MKNKIMLIAPQYYPIPAVKGGAVETLITNLITENEIHGDAFFYVISKYDNEAMRFKYNNSKIFYIDGSKSPSITFKLHCFLRKLLFNRFTKKVFKGNAYAFRELTFFAYQCNKIAKKIKPNIIVSESYDQVHRLWPLVKRFGRENFYYHLHYVRDNEPSTRQLVPNTIAISKYVLKNWTADDGVNGKQLVLYNGIDLNAFSKKGDKTKYVKLRNRLGLSSNDFVVLFSGRLRPHKGVLQLLRAFSLLQDSNIKLLLVGDFLSESQEHQHHDEREFEQKCISIIKSNKNIIRTGNIPYYEIPDYYAISNIQCIPSMWEEGAGLVAIEGMASGLPLIITNSGGMPEYTSNEAAIILQRDERLEDNIASSIMLLKNNHELFNKMSIAGRERAKEFTKENYYRQYIDFLLMKGDEANE